MCTNYNFQASKKFKATANSYEYIAVESGDILKWYIIQGQCSLSQLPAVWTDAKSPSLVAFYGNMNNFIIVNEKIISWGSTLHNINTKVWNGMWKLWNVSINIYFKEYSNTVTYIYIIKLYISYMYNIHVAWCRYRI